MLNGGPVAGLARSGEVAELLRAPALDRGEAAALDREAVGRGAVTARTGFDLSAPYGTVEADRSGVHAVRLREMGRLEVLLGAVDRGYLVVNGKLRDLPIGSHLDTSTGTFTWNPPVGYFGTYRLVFVGGGQKTVVDVTVAPEGATLELKPERGGGR